MADKPDKPNDDFIIPKAFTDKLQEFTNGGFILITFSSKGNPVIHQYYETKKDQLALESELDIFAEKLSRDKYKDPDEEGGEDDEEGN